MIRYLIAILVAFTLSTAQLVAQEPAPSQEPGEHVAAQSTREMEAGDFFLTQFVHLMPHAIRGEHKGLTTFYDVNLFQLIALGIILLVFVPVGLSFRAGRTPWILRVFRGWVHWLRDEVVAKTMGPEDAERFTPFFVYLFFFILFMNLLGLIPGSVTATATAFVTGAMALVTFTIMIGGGMIAQGPVNYIKHLLPGGLPGWLIPLMAVVELIGLFVKPFALMIRLFANMLAGHLLIYSFVGMIFVFAKLLDLSAVTWVPGVLTVGMAVFIMIIEAFVVVLQAYIFVFLSVLFIQDSLHPAH